MRSLARITATTILVVGGIASLVLMIAGLAAFGDYGSGWVQIGLAFATFVSSASSACVLGLLASIDEKLERGAPRTTTGSGVGKSKPRAYPGIGTVPVGPQDALDADLDSKAEFERSRGQ